MGRFARMIEHGTQFSRDAWIAAEFAKLSGADGVRLLHPEPFPDFAVSFGADIRHFEATEAIRPGRRRGDEFREDLALIEAGELPISPDPDEGWLTPDKAFEMLQTSSTKKAAKAYAANCGLVVYLNESYYGGSDAEIMSVFPEATQAAGEAFLSVHVLWDGKLNTPWSAN